MTMVSEYIHTASV